MLANDRTRDAVARLIDVCREFSFASDLLDAAVIISADFHDHEMAFIKGASTKQAFKNIRQRSIALVGQFESRIPKAPATSPPAASANQLSATKLRQEYIALENRDPVLRCINIKKSYKKYGFSLDHITFEINVGEMISIIGANASGKTTLIEILSGILRPDDGDLTFPAICRER